MADVGPALVKVAKAVGATDYNVLQNNGANAHQAVGHVHFHIIPKIGTEGKGKRSGKKRKEKRVNKEKFEQIVLREKDSELDGTKNLPITLSSRLLPNKLRDACKKKIKRL